MVLCTLCFHTVDGFVQENRDIWLHPLSVNGHKTVHCVSWQSLATDASFTCDISADTACPHQASRHWWTQTSTGDHNWVEVFFSAIPSSPNSSHNGIHGNTEKCMYSNANTQYKTLPLLYFNMHIVVYKKYCTPCQLTRHTVLKTMSFFHSCTWCRRVMIILCRS